VDQSAFEDFSAQVFQGIKDRYDDSRDVDAKHDDIQNLEDPVVVPKESETDKDETEDDTPISRVPSIIVSEASVDQSAFEDFSAQVFQGIKDRYDDSGDDVAEDDDIQNLKDIDPVIGSKEAETTETETGDETAISKVPSIILSEPSIDQSAFEDFSAQVFQGIKDRYDDSGEDHAEDDVEETDDDKIVTTFTVVDKDQNTIEEDKKEILDDDLIEKSFTVVEDTAAIERTDKK